MQEILNISIYLLGRVLLTSRFDVMSLWLFISTNQNISSEHLQKVFCFVAVEKCNDTNLRVIANIGTPSQQ